jgi:enoyl-CoA hydratase/carnithine racemase
MTEHIKIKQDGAVLEIIFARPDKKNALSGAVVATKRLMRDKQRILGRMAEEGAVFAQRLQSNEAREAFNAFAERRQPDFTKLASREATAR